jgi:hypothetical protein
MEQDKRLSLTSRFNNSEEDSEEEAFEEGDEKRRLREPVRRF